MLINTVTSTKIHIISGKLLKGRGIYPLELCEKFIIHLTKVALGVLCAQPFSYVPLIRPSLEFALYYCFTEQGMALIYERFTIQCLNIVKGILQCVEYKLPKGMDQVKEPCEYWILLFNYMFHKKNVYLPISVPYTKKF